MTTDKDTIRKLVKALDAQSKELNFVNGKYAWFMRTFMELMEAGGTLPYEAKWKKGLRRARFVDTMPDYVNGPFGIPVDIPIPNLPKGYKVNDTYWVPESEVSRRRWWKRVDSPNPFSKDGVSK